VVPTTTSPSVPATGYYPVILKSMKTAISVPDETFDQATRQAAELGISRSEFFTRAARRYLDELASRSLTEQVNDALQAAGSDDSAAAATAAGRRLLVTGDDW
jgi:Arc/MetJ family transcription regulator